jgi:hypothetical protein
VSSTEVRQFDQVHQYLRPGDLLSEGGSVHFFFADNWAKAQAGSFAPIAPGSR